jgi:hypothetical protein
MVGQTSIVFAPPPNRSLQPTAQNLVAAPSVLGFLATLGRG